MAYSYTFIDHTADIAYLIEGNNLEDLLRAAGEGLKESSLEEFEPVDLIKITFELFENAPEEVIITFLSKLNFLIQMKRYAYVKIDNVECHNNHGEIDAKIEVLVEKFNEEKHSLKEEIKAITYHQSTIYHHENKMKMLIVLDI